ncbi:MAG: hypothetical protein ACREXX_05395 [Gammaproteobacteria bacterium]
MILPGQLHCVWTLPPGDTDYFTRWNLIKGLFSRAIEKGRSRFAKPRQAERTPSTAAPFLGTSHP